MNWIKELAELYDVLDAKADRDPRLLPLYHSAANADVTVTIDWDGNFIKAERLSKVEFGEKDFRMTQFAGTPGALSRSSQIAPRLLMDRLMYVAGDFDDLLPPPYMGAYEKYHASYMQQLEDWLQSPYGHDVARVVCDYLKKDTLLHDIAEDVLLPELCKASDKKRAELAKENGTVFALVKELYAQVCEPKGRPGNKKTGVAADKLNIRWCIAVDAEDEVPLETWRLKDMADNWVRYMHGIMEQTGTRGFDHIYGKKNEVLVKSWFPWVMAPTCNLSVISSCRQDCQYQFGQYSSSQQMFGVGLETADKAMRMLRYLIEVQGKRYYDREGLTGAIAVWANGTAGCAMPDIESLFAVDEPDEETVWGKLYHSNMSRVLSGIRRVIESDGAKTVCMMEFKKTSPGRVAISQCQEISVDEFCENLKLWYAAAEWRQLSRNEEGEWKESYGVPTALTLARYGTLAKGRCMMGAKVDNTNVTYHWYSRIVRSIFFHERVPKNMVETLVDMAISFNANEQKFGRRYFERKVGLACSMAAAYYNYEERVYTPMLDTSITNRDYLFGRAWGCVDMLCQQYDYWQWRTGKNQSAKTFAERNIGGFANLPFSTLEQAVRTVKGIYIARYPRLKEFGDELDAIIAQLQVQEQYFNKPLQSNWILGYSAELTHLRAELKKQREIARAAG